MNIVSMLIDALQSIFKPPATERYPVEQKPVPTRLRGKLHWNPKKCTGCCLCMKDCPSDAIKIITIDQKNKQFVMRYDIGKCAFCSQCVQNCRFQCLEMTNDEWELASQRLSEFVVYYGDEEDVKHILEGNAAAADSKSQT